MALSRPYLSQNGGCLARSGPGISDVPAQSVNTFPAKNESCQEVNRMKVLGAINQRPLLVLLVLIVGLVRSLLMADSALASYPAQSSTHIRQERITGRIVGDTLSQDD